MGVRRLARALGLSTFLSLAWSVPAEADPITIGAFLAGIGSTIGITAPIATTAAAIGAFNAGVAFVGFVASQAGSLLVSAAAVVIGALNSRPMEQNTVNVKVPAASRWHVAGTRKVGGAAVFGDFDADGAFWFIIVHCDEELMAFDHYEFDNIPLTLSGSFAFGTGRQVTSTEFKGWSGGVLGQLQSLNPFYTIWTSTYSPDDPVPNAPPAAFLAAFPEWTANHKLAGTTFSVVKIDPCDDKQRTQIYKWQQGAFHLGEPGLSIVGTWARIYDPRDGGQDIDDQSTWGTSTNAALIFAWNRYRRFGFNQPMDSFNWTEIAAEADICDELVEDKYGFFAPRYACGVAFSEDSPNIACEQEILLTCDGVRLYDDVGKVYVKTGHWEAPTVTLSADRDIFAMESRDPNNGEAPLDGVIVTYTDPDSGYVPQPSAPWQNPDYYDPARTPNYLAVTIAGCTNHNQAVRLAKAIGKRQQPTLQLAPTIGLRALLLWNQRTVTLDYDATISGTYQIISPIELDASLRVGLLAMVPVDANNWTLLPGEEGDKPRNDQISNDNTVPELDAADVTLVSVPIAGSNGNSVRIEATFPAPSSTIYSYEFLYSSDGGGNWNAMATDMQALKASSPVVNANGSYEVRWRTVTSGNNASDYSDPVTVTGFAHITADMTVVRADTTVFTADAA